MIKKANKKVAVLNFVVLSPNFVSIISFTFTS